MTAIRKFDRAGTDEQKLERDLLALIRKRHPKARRRFHDALRLKELYPLEFYAAALKQMRNRPDEREATIAEAKRHGIRFLPPHVNHSGAIERIEGDAIRIGLWHLPGIWKPWIGLLCMWRVERGEFKTVRSVLGLPNDPCPIPAQSREGKAVLKALRRAGALRGLRP